MRTKTIEDSYQEYLKLPLVTRGAFRVSRELYDNQWCILTGLACMDPHPHRHYTLEEFKLAIQAKPELKERFG